MNKNKNMRVTLFTGNQPRHINLANELSMIAKKVFVISEVKNGFALKAKETSKRTPFLNEYFEKVFNAENEIFNKNNFSLKNTKTSYINCTDLNLLSKNELKEALQSDIYIVYGSSFIKSWLVDFLIDKEALNIHIGLSPFYRGSSCNFWALYDYNPQYVGATILMLSKGIDSGDIIFHCLPKFIDSESPFNFTMRSVLASHFGIIEGLSTGNLLLRPRQKQSRKKEIRYSKSSDFTSKIAFEFLNRKHSIDIKKHEYPELLAPQFY